MAVNENPTLLVADDQVLMRDGIVLLIQTALPGSECKTAGNYSEVIRQIDAQAAKSRFNTIILDLRMPGMRGIESLEQIAQRAEGTPIIVCTALEDPGLSHRLMNCGIYRAVTKAAGAEELLKQVRAALSYAGSSPTSYRTSAQPNRCFNPLTQTGSSTLTNRQREILKMLHSGKPSKVIATQLGVSLGTIKSHLHTLYSIMDVSSRSEAIVKSQNWLL